MDYDRKAVAAAEAQVESLRKRANAGETVPIEEVRAAKQAVRDARDQAEFAEEVRRGQVRRHNEAKIAVLSKEAARLEDEQSHALGRYQAAAVQLDQIMHSARQAAEKMNNVGQELFQARQAAWDHNQYGLPAEVERNPVLKAIHPSERPKAQIVECTYAGPLGSPVRAELIVTARHPMTETIGSHSVVQRKTATEAVEAFVARVPAHLRRLCS